MTQLAIDVQSGAPRLSPAWLGAVVLVHAGLLAVLLDAPDMREEIILPRPLTVKLIEPEPETPQPRPDPTPPRPVAKPLPIPPLLAAKPLPSVLPTPQPVAEAPNPLPLPESDVLPSLKPSTEAVSAPAPPPIIPPRQADYLANPKPPYPPLSRRQGEEGTVRLSILVNPDGSVARLELAQSSGHPRLDRSAMDTVQSSWTFEPARQRGKPVAAWVIVPIQFTLRS